MKSSLKTKWKCSRCARWVDEPLERVCEGCRGKEEGEDE